MAYSKAKLKSNGDRASPCFKPFLIGNIRKFPTWNEISCTNLQLPPEPLTRGLPPPDPHSLCPQLNLNPPEQNSWVCHCPKLMFWRKEKLLPLSRYWSMIRLSRPQSNNTMITPAQIQNCWDWGCMNTTRIMVNYNANKYILHLKHEGVMHDRYH